MKVFIEDPGSKGKQTAAVLLLDIREAKLLQEMVEAAADAAKRKPTWRKLAKTLADRLAVW